MVSPPRTLLRWLAGLLATLVVAPLCVTWAFSVHEPRCEDAEPFWNGDRPYGEGPVQGVILGSSSMGLDLDVHALAAGTGHAWQRVARHAVEQSSIPASYPRLLGSSAASPGLRTLVLETSPLLFDAVGCARPEVANIPLRPAWWTAARTALGPDAELAPSLAMGFLPHRQIMTSGRRTDIIHHLKRPKHALRVLTDLRYSFDGVEAPTRWTGEPPPDITTERALKRRQFLIGAPLDTYVPHVNAACVATLAAVAREAGAERTILVIPPLRTILRDAVPADYRAELHAAIAAVARDGTHVEVYDATDRFAGEEDAHFTDFDHLNERGAAVFTAELVDHLTGGTRGAGGG